VTPEGLFCVRPLESPVVVTLFSVLPPECRRTVGGLLDRGGASAKLSTSAILQPTGFTVELNLQESVSSSTLRALRALRGYPCRMVRSIPPEKLVPVPESRPVSVIRPHNVRFPFCSTRKVDGGPQRGRSRVSRFLSLPNPMAYNRERNPASSPTGTESLPGLIHARTSR
jgi:hypothetical protein